MTPADASFLIRVLATAGYLAPPARVRRPPPLALAREWAARGAAAWALADDPDAMRALIAYARHETIKQPREDMQPGWSHCMSPHSVPKMRGTPCVGAMCPRCVEIIRRFVPPPTVRDICLAVDMS